MASPLPPDPYQALGVPKNAPIATIRSAHRKLVLQCHPDKVQDESLRAQKQDEFQKVQQAYEILSDDQRRQRYDEQVKLAELRREVLERGGGRGAAHYEIPSAATVSPFFEVRAGRIYEERVPGRSFEDDHMSSRYEQQRASARKYEGYEASSRRPSGREQDERRRAKALEDERERLRVAKERVRETERSNQSDRRRTREKDRRREYDDKYSRRSYVEDATDSDSDDTEVYYGNKQGGDSRKRHEEVRRKERVVPETPRRTGSLRDEADMDEWDRKIMSARDYIEKSRGAGGPVEVDARRPAAYRNATTSGAYVEPRSTLGGDHRVKLVIVFESTVGQDLLARSERAPSRLWSLQAEVTRRGRSLVCQPRHPHQQTSRFPSIRGVHRNPTARQRCSMSVTRSMTRPVFFDDLRQVLWRA